MASTSTNAKRMQHQAEELLDQAKEAVRKPAGDIVESLRDYAHKNPESAALWCLGIGFVLGWRLKPW
jgi:ElaB/YqjD/DUF883 family membrane-anchored ribosome-binding protein